MIARSVPTPRPGSPLPARGRHTVVASLLVAALLVGCATVRTTGRRPDDGEGGGVAVRVFADDDARRAGRPAADGVVSVLERRDGREWHPVFRSLDARWTVTGLPPGKYRVRFTGALDQSGALRPFRPLAQPLRLRAGEVVEVDATLEHVSPALVAVGVATAVVAAVLLHDWLEDHIPLPPLPDPDLVEAVFTVAMHVGISGGCCDPGGGAAPFVTSHFPEDDALVAARRVRVVFAMSEPLRPGELADDTITVVGESSGPIAGVVSYEPDSWWVVWEPDEDLPRGDTFHVRLDPGTVEDVDGLELGSAAELSFRTR